MFRERILQCTLHFALTKSNVAFDHSFPNFRVKKNEKKKNKSGDVLYPILCLLACVQCCNQACCRRSQYFCALFPPTYFCVFFFHMRLVFVFINFYQKALVSTAKRFPMYCTGNNIYDKQVQGGSVHIIEPGTFECLPKTKSVVCEVLKEGKIKVERQICRVGPL